MIMNCLFDCDYCYLQGMYPSPHIVMFVNTDDFFNAVEEKLNKLKQVYLCISYDTDLLLFERYLPTCQRWIEFASERKNLTIELRTKSANFAAIKKKTPPKNFIIAWTLSPEAVIERYEKRTPSLNSRLKNIQEAIALGWSVRICFDPLLNIDSAREVYQDFVDLVAKAIPLNSILDATIGVFRINKGYLNRMQKSSSFSSIIHYPYQTVNEVCSYRESDKAALIDSVKSRLKLYIEENKITVI